MGTGARGAGRGFGGFGYRARRSSGRYKPTHGFPVDIAIGGGADGEGGTSPSPVSDPQSSALVTPPRPASGLLPRPRGRGQCVAIPPEIRARACEVSKNAGGSTWISNTIRQSESASEVSMRRPKIFERDMLAYDSTPHPLPFKSPDVHSTQEPGAGLQARGRQPAPEMHVCGAW
jgi:hypothetical protein